MNRRWLPHPWLTLTLWLVWMLLANAWSVGQALLGVLIALLLTRATAAFWPERPRVRRPGRLAAYLAMLPWDILVANLQVARLILGLGGKPQPAFIEVPIDLRDPFALTVLASVISLTPGTVSADLSPDRRWLLVHSLDVDDPVALTRHLKQRYEAPLLEIFD